MLYEVITRVGRDLLQWSSTILVENGGDIFIKSDTPTIFTIYAGSSPLSMKTGIKVAQQVVCHSTGRALQIGVKFRPAQVP